ncbi:8850_t:CDS:2 [Ambispora gerdemannii]|uniref:8850_t:CDS:1 n=1 Tax=Ambispora gerdemannii TaxID=144530 RepID=A0A9N8ZG54_9GLOM|nr:8850_t:CDS:2 [Ambispora gerdemannii]
MKRIYVYVINTSNKKSKKQQRNKKIAYENHKSLYPSYKPKSAKDSSVKKWVFREQKKYALTSSHKPSSTSNNSPPQETAQIFRSSSLNSTTSTIEYIHTAITTSTTIDDTHLSTINTNNANIQYVTITCSCNYTINTNNSINMSNVNEITIISLLNLSGNVNNADIYDEASINNASNNNSSQSNQFITNNPTTPLTSSPSLSQLFIPESDILNINFEELLHDNFS